MDYYKLAEQLMDLRASRPQLRVERKMSKMMKGEIFALNYLAANRNKAHPKNMSEDMMLTTARIAAILKSLEKRKLITRAPDPSDNRQIIVELTEAGIEIVHRRRRELLGTVAKILEALGEEDARNYVRIQQKLVELGSVWI